MRNPIHAAEEKAIFDAFLRAHPSFARTIVRTIQPDTEFPDLIVEVHDGGKIDFELGEWIHESQMAHARRREKLGEAIEFALGDQGKNNSQYFDLVRLFPRGEILRFRPTDTSSFKKNVWDLIGETERRWPTERFWHSPQGRQVTDFGSYPALGKYVSKVIFDPLEVGEQEVRYPDGFPWIVMSAPVSSYSSETAMNALRQLVYSKIARYGDFVGPVRLLVYYGRAVAYNTPWFGINYREFQDVARAAANMVKEQSRFEKIYLFQALEHGLESFEIYPFFNKCD